mmetsp:Transcript_9286/g.10778  ORF Transcript_9286/g.10778 Transcript_9286/m.10778 type:complete len:80 (-) Transcript_9286:35-274(-)
MDRYSREIQFQSCFYSTITKLRYYALSCNFMDRSNKRKYEEKDLMAFDIYIHNVDWTGNEFLAIYVTGGCLFSRRGYVH